MRSYAKWQELGVRRADGASFARPGDQVKLWLPVAGGPAFLVGQNFRAVYSYNPSMSYTLALCHLGDRIRGDLPFRQQFPGGERVPTLDEVKEIQRRLNENSFKTHGIVGRTGSDTIKAILAYQKKVGMEPADGYATSSKYSPIAWGCNPRFLIPLCLRYRFSIVYWCIRHPASPAFPFISID
jgi:hypothetical protein